MVNEHRLKRRVDEFLTRLKREKHPVWFVKIHGGGVFQRVGLPDFLLLLNGRFGAMELKRPSSGLGARPSQERELRWIERAGGFAWVEDDYEEIRRKILSTLGDDRIDW